MVAAELEREVTHSKQRRVSTCYSLTRVAARVTIFTVAFMFLLLTLGTGHTAGGLSETNPGVGDSGVYSRAAVATDSGVCSEVGVAILKQGGSAVDAAIASTLCIGVVNLHSTGIGGGGFMIYYEAATQQVHAVDFREVAPLAATYNMYEGLEPTASAVGESSICHPYLDKAGHGRARGIQFEGRKSSSDTRNFFRGVDY